MTLVIKDALPADVETVAELHTRARATYYRGWIAEEEYLGARERARTRQGWQAAVGRGDGSVLCAQRDGEIVGVAAFREVDGQMTLTQLHVDPRAWRQGVGAALHAVCLDRWRAAGVDRVRLDVYEHNLRAQSFYQALGWAREAPFSGSHFTLWFDMAQCARCPP
ncbi:GNAT family N-acetyltransferase [Streptomyces sp. NPDC006879]|uniref:GNAT family N-acetyltransferase n=1 Tax=Streptomyces sp. NPDC006879 TaxID=3364767 RepID=UPI0036B77E71